MTDPRLGLPSASQIYILDNCEGQKQLEHSIPEEELKPVREAEQLDGLADRGTRIHKARETGQTLDLDAEELVLYQDGIKCEEAHFERWADLFQLSEGFEGPREERLWLHDQRTMAPLCSGQLDVHYLNKEQEPTHALICDWKTAFCNNLVKAPGNAQLRLQAVLLKTEHPTLTNIRVAFVKNMYANAELDYADYGEADLAFSLQSVMFTLWKSTQPEAARRPGVHCNWCPCKGHCPEAAAMALLPSVMAEQALATIDAKPEQKVDMMQLVDLKKLWDLSTVINKILTVGEARLKKLSPEQLQELGLKLKDGVKLRDFNTKAAFDLLRDKQAWPEEILWECMEFGTGKLKKHAVIHAGCSTEKTADRWVKETLLPVTTEREGNKRLV